MLSPTYWLHLLAAGLCWTASANGAGTIAGCVTDQHGKPLSRVGIRIESQDLAHHFSTQTGRNGCYRFGGLSAGIYSVSAEPRGTKLSPSPRTIELSGDARADFTIDQDANVTAGTQTARTTSQQPGAPLAAGDEVSEPVPLYTPPPTYTEEARAAHVEGTVRLSLVVDPEGKATNVQVIKSLDKGLDQRAIEAVETWRFKPGTKDRQPVSRVASVEVTFRLLTGPPAPATNNVDPASGHSEYVRDGSIGSTKPNVQLSKDGWPEFKTIPIDEWVGKRVIFLPKPAALRQYGYQFFQGGSGQFGSPTYEEAAGKIGKIVAVEGGPDAKVVIQIESSGARFVGTLYTDTLNDIAFLDEIDEAKKELAGRTLWTLARSGSGGADQARYGDITTYNDASGSYGSIKLKKFSPVKVTDVVLGWDDSTPVRLIVQTEMGEEGFVDVSISGTNISGSLAALTRIDRHFALVDPKTAYPWRKAVWDEIQDEKIALGMTPDQVRLSWGTPQAINETVTAAGKTEQWVFSRGAYVYFTGGVVTGVRNSERKIDSTPGCT